MRIITSLGVASLVGLWAASALAFTSTGILESVTPSRNEVRIRNGDAYRLPADTDLSGLKVGQKVHVFWDNQEPSTLSEGKDRYIRLLNATSIRPATN
ncbi:DUF1344 domain-containing protein [Brucella pituitosa]|uniref:DUF1344 domain-containing protein n=1 Tax=Brucella pituitosa TaxID=571256 RepID=UPI003C74C046